MKDAGSLFAAKAGPQPHACVVADKVAPARAVHLPLPANRLVGTAISEADHRHGGSKAAAARACSAEYPALRYEAVVLDTAAHAALFENATPKPVMRGTSEGEMSHFEQQQKVISR